MSNAVKEKEKLIEMLGVHFQMFHHLPPLAARIFSTLILSCKERGLSFDEIVTMTEASKSSVSTNLNLLLKMEKIRFYTVKGERKKYFKPKNLTDRIKNHLKILSSEQRMFKLLRKHELQYNEHPLSEKEEKSLEIYKDYLKNFENLLKESINKIEELEQIN
ncbi:MAG: GbsR/MarR family transcriptional regulator [Flavobacteriales bacterium]